MQKNLLVMLLLVALVACKNKTDEPTVVENQSPKPSWQAQENPDYSASMTIVCVPPQGEPANVNDEIAAFWGDTCRGVAQMIDDSVFYLGVSGEEQEMPMQIRYYSGTYQTIRIMNTTYVPNEIRGSYDEPFVLNF